MSPNPFVDSALAELRQGRFRAAAWRRLGATLFARSRATAVARPELVREVRAAQAVGVVAALLLGIAAWAVDGVGLLGAVFVPAAAWVVLCEWVRVELGLVRHPVDDTPGERVGAANWLTLYRGWVAVPGWLIAAAAPAPTALWAAITIVAGLTDLVDGSLARWQHTESRLGRLLDPVLDAFFFTATAAALARWGLVPWWVAAVVGLRYFAPVIGGLAIMVARGASLPVRHTPWGQRSTLAIGLALLGAWLAPYVAMPGWVPAALYAVAIVAMALALLGIARRLPAPRT